MELPWGEIHSGTLLILQIHSWEEHKREGQGENLDHPCLIHQLQLIRPTKPSLSLTFDGGQSHNPRVHRLTIHLEKQSWTCHQLGYSHGRSSQPWKSIGSWGQLIPTPKRGWTKPSSWWWLYTTGLPQIHTWKLWMPSCQHHRLGACVNCTTSLAQLLQQSLCW